MKATKLKQQTVLEQKCSVEKVQDNTLFLKPIKQQCSTCNGKCANMLKPESHIEYYYKGTNIKKGDEVILYMNKADLSKMVICILGVPLAIVIMLIVILSSLKVSELYIIIASIISLVLSFVIINKTISMPKQSSIRKI